MTPIENVPTGCQANRDAQQINRNHCNPNSLSGQSVSCNKRYSSLATYVCDDVRFKRKDNLDAWTTVGRYAGEMFISYPFFEFIPGTKGDEEPLRHGDFVIDIDTKELAMGSAKKIIDWFYQVYGVDPEQWRVYLSGKKGVHLELPAGILGTESGHKFLTLAYKRLAKDIEGELNLALDTSMYNRGTGKPYRQPNVMRDIGTCKRQIDHEDLYNITTEEEYTAACSEPGRTWQPEDVSENTMLASKLQHYLKESDAQQEAIRTAPVLTDDERDRLVANIPPCMVILSRLTNYAGKPNRTYNDIAIQLTAYAITAKFTENDFLVGCKIFIENYPSSSLDTIAKRYDNCRARFRTMAANGNHHSCGGVLALGIPGFDCESCTAKPAGPILEVAVMSADDVKKVNLSLNIPEEILNPGGLISLGMEALSVPGLPNIPQYNMPVVLTMLANAIAGKITFQGQWPNVYNIKIGPTSSGKTSSDLVMVDAITNSGLTDFYGVTDFASGPALMRSVADQPISMIVIDEATSLFKRYDKGDPIGDGKRDALLEIYSKSGRRISKAYADKRNAIEIDYPCLSLTGNATPVIYDSIREEDFNTGTMQRWDFWSYDGLVPQRGKSLGGVNEPLVKFVAGLAAIMESKAPGGNLVGIRGGKSTPFAMEITEPASKILEDWSIEIVARTNAADSEGESGIISRAYNLCIKYAMIHHAATNPVETMYSPLDERDIEYGKKVAWMLGDWKINVLRDRVTTGDFHQKCEIFKQARDVVQRNGRRPTFATMCHKRAHMKNWTPKQSAEVIDALVKRGEIILDDSKKPTAYLRPKHNASA